MIMQYKKINVKATKEYDICIGRGILAGIGELIAPVLGKCRLAVLTDSNVNALYGAAMMENLASAGYDACKYVIPAGEASKCADNLLAFLNFLAGEQLTRSDAIVAFGGGVVGDLAGLSASLYLRGVKYVQVPTTLLAAVDSSVGGKTAIDIPAGKNLAGAFWQPSLVVIDPDCLKTLPDREFSAGMAEVIKYGVINDRPLFELLKGGFHENIEQIIASCVANKSRIVEKDEFDTGARQLLNLGHTVGHAIEARSSFAISHGSAVAIGMAIVTRAAVAMGICPESDLLELTALLQSAALPTECDYSAEELTSAALGDKKRLGNKISLVIPYAIGDSRLLKIGVDELESFIQKGLSK